MQVDLDRLQALVAQDFLQGKWITAIEKMGQKRKKTAFSGGSIPKVPRARFELATP